MAQDPRFQQLYDMFETFKNECLIGDQSILWPEKNLWTLENILEIKRRFIDSPIITTDLSFEDKLLEQMKGASSELWGVVSEIYFIYFLPSSFITLDKKMNDITWAASQGGLIPPSPENDIWKSQSSGFTRTAIRYHYKYAQFWLIILLALEVKQSKERTKIFADPKSLQDTLDSILDEVPSKFDRAYDMRHAILYLSFPDRYERSISTRDKEQIVKTYQSRIDGQLPDDIDEKIKVIRDEVSKDYHPEGRPFDFYEDVKSEWKSTKGGSLESQEIISQIEGETTIPENDEEGEFSQFLNTLSHTKNVILYGPPGTGKTYIARQVARALITPQLKVRPSESIIQQQAIDGLTMYDVIALSLYLSGLVNHRTVPEIQAHELIQLRLSDSLVKKPNNFLWGTLQSHTIPESKTVKYSGKNHPFIFDKDENSRWYLTQSGIDYVQESLAESIELLNKDSTYTSNFDNYIRWVTFHQSYAYEDFVEGLRPVTTEEDPSNISYEIVPGVFRETCKRAKQDPANKYIMIIDEINRGNIAKIFGELITLLEDDKRSGEVNELNIQLPYSQEIFSVPNNLYIIGTMNTADRSIALIDVALRRRFAFVEIMPRSDLLAGIVIETDAGSVDLSKLLERINRAIIKNIDRDHQIGHSYFMKVGDVEGVDQIEVLEFVWNHQIIPLLEEYFYSQRDKLAEMLAPFLPEKEVDAEFESSAYGSIGRAYGEDLVYALSKLAMDNL